MLSTVETFILDTWKNSNNITELDKEITTNVDSALKKLVVDTKLNNINISINDIIKNISLDIMTNSKCFDTILRCKNYDIKIHGIFLKCISSFGQMRDFNDGMSKESDIKIININDNFNFNDMLCVKKYLYTGKLEENEYIVDNCFELLIQIDYFGLLNFALDENNNPIIDNNLIKLLSSFIEINYNKRLDFTFKKFNFDTFCNVIRQVCDILVNNKIDIMSKIATWFNDNMALYNDSELVCSCLFEKHLVKTSIGKTLVIKHLLFDKFDLITKSENQLELTNLILEHEPPNMFTILLEMAYKCDNKLVRLIDLPITIFQDDLYKRLTDGGRYGLIIKYKKYELLNNLSKLDENSIMGILKIPEIINSITNKTCLNIIKTTYNSKNISCRHIKDILYYNPNFLKHILITSYLPLQFYHCITIGVIKQITTHKDKIKLDVSLNTKAYDTVIRPQMKILIPGNSNNETYEIARIFSTNLNGEKIEEFIIINLEGIEQQFELTFDKTNSKLMTDVKVDFPILLVTMEF